MKKTLFTLLMIIWSMMITACSNENVSNQNQNQNEDVIKIGYIWALTWDAASFWEEEKNVINMFLQQNPTWAWKKIEVIFEDWQCNGQMAANAAQKLITADDVQLILWWVCSWETLAAAPVVNKGKVVLFSSVSTSPEVTTAWEYVFRNAPSDERATDVMTDIVSEKYKKVAIISQNNDFAQAYRKKLIEKFPWKWVEIVIDETFNTWNIDFKTALSKIKNSEAQALLNIAWEISPWGYIVKQAMEISLGLPIYWPETLAWIEFFEIAKNAAEWATVVMLSADKQDPWIVKLVDSYRKLYWKKLNYDAYAALNYDRLNIVKNAIEAVEYNWEAIRDYLLSMPVYDWLWGKTAFDENWDSSLARPSVLVAKDWEYIILKK